MTVYSMGTLEPISKKEMLYVLKHYTQANIVVTNAQHPRKKTRYLEMDNQSKKYLDEYRNDQNSKIVEKHGWFTEEYVDSKTGQKKKHEVFYK